MQNIPWVAAAAMIGFIGNEAVALLQIRTGRKIGSDAMIADGLHARIDGLTSLAVLVAAWLGAASGEALAQEKHKYYFKAPPGTSKFTQTHLLDVGDLPGHQMRIAELQSKFPGEAPTYGGVKVVEARTVIFSDYTNGNGTAFYYAVSTLENGDKIFQRGEIMAHKTVTDGARRTSFTSVGSSRS